MAAEPVMSDYTHYPIFLTNAVEPNILIMLDNSGSMNFNAYGTWPGDGGTVTDSFLGDPYPTTIESRVSESWDDAEERKSDGYTYYDNGDLDLGRDISTDYPNQIIGVRFQNLKIPQGSTITSAYIEFNTQAIYTGTQATISLDIHGEASDNAEQFNSTNKNISSRTKTSANSTWSVNSWDDADVKHQTPDLKGIIQEIVNRTGWSSGNSMAFTITNPGDDPSSGRMATSYDNNPNKAPKLHIEISGKGSTRYYGYFNPDYFYYYNSNKFDHKYKKVEYDGGSWSVEDLNGASKNLIDADIVSEGLWDGNWLNWLCMRRVDVLRKVLMGGLVTSRQGGGNETAYGETPAQSDRTFIRNFNSSTGSAVSPYDGDYSYKMEGGYIYVDSTKFIIAVQKDVQYDPDDFYNDGTDDNLGGILQKYGDKARWGNEFFNTGTGNYNGGYIQHTIGTNMTTLITNLQNIGCDTWTPLAESYYVAMQYFKQEDVEVSLYKKGIPNDNLGDDPYHNGTEFVHCAKSFVILLTDGASTKDSMIPTELKDYDGDLRDNKACVESSNCNCDYESGGTDYLDDVALYARTNDLRPDLDGEQNLLLYTVYAMGDDNNARQLLKDAARNGGFEDRNGDGVPNGDYTSPLKDRLEWDQNGDAIPDTYFEASDGYKLEKELGKAITDILARAASGTAVSVISSATAGEGNLVQAYFRPLVTTGAEDVKWVGFLQSLWIDQYGNMREDSNSDQQLNENIDKIIKFVDDNGEIKVQRYAVSSDVPYPDMSTATPVDTLLTEDISPIWEAGSALAQRAASDRNIFTFIDQDQNGTVAESEIVNFDTGNASSLKPYLGVDDSGWDYLGSSSVDRVDNLINFIRGENSNFTGDANIRGRSINGQDWKLGDIVHSTPVLVAAPMDNYDLLYGDKSYFSYYNAMKDRETVVYTGANDGMLHAFTSWKYDGTDKKFTKPSGTTGNIGDELWAFIPQCLLPHLKWLPDKNYTHVNYVGLKPKIFDARILSDDSHYTDSDTEDNWGTILLVGMNYGGKHIWAKGDYDGDGTLETRHFYPSYVCMDVTDPRAPKLLWEKTYSMPSSLTKNADNNTDLGLTTSYPAIVKVGEDSDEKWFAVFGSGPVDFDGTSDRLGHIFVVDLKTGEPYNDGTDDWLFKTDDDRAFMASATSLDKNMNYNVDAIYIGETHDAGNPAGSIWKGAMYKITVPWECNAGTCIYGDTDKGEYINNPIDWSLSKLFESPGPITASPVLSVDNLDNAWIFFGTGRYLSDDDKTNADQQYIVGIKDPFFNEKHIIDSECPDCFQDDYYHSTSSLLLTQNKLFDADPYTVLNGGVVNGGGGIKNFSQLTDEARKKDGWYRSLANSGERNLTKPAIIGGTLLTTTFVPDNDICGFGGESYLYGFYYETGTAYKRPVFSDGLEPISDTEKKVKDVISLGEGLASSPGIHIGRQEDGKATAYIQTSKGNIKDLVVDPALKFRSGLKSWIEK